MAGQFDMIELHLDSQIDSKTLRSTYVCTDVPGEFKGQPGALTQALTKGLWVVIEDIDRAPFEVLSALVPLLETRKILLPGRGEVIEAAPGFRLFATYSTTNESGEINLYGGTGELLKNFWTKVKSEALPLDEVTYVLKAFHIPENIMNRIIQTFLSYENNFSNNDIFNENMNDGSSSSSSSSSSMNNNKKQNIEMHKLHLTRSISLRDIIRWTNRIVFAQHIQRQANSASYQTEQEDFQS